MKIGIAPLEYERCVMSMLSFYIYLSMDLIYFMKNNQSVLSAIPLRNKQKKQHLHNGLRNKSS